VLTKEKDTTITEAEWEVMKVIWSHKKVTSREVCEILHDKMSWSVSTVKTLLARLVDKKCVKTSKLGNKFIYQPIIMEQQAVLDNLNEDINRLCQKKKGKILYQLISQQSLTQQDIENLSLLLDEKKQMAPLELPCNCIVGQCNCQK